MSREPCADQEEDRVPTGIREDSADLKWTYREPTGPFLEPRTLCRLGIALSLNGPNLPRAERKAEPLRRLWQTIQSLAPGSRYASPAAKKWGAFPSRGPLSRPLLIIICG